MQQILVQEGETVDVGTRLAVIGAPGAAPTASDARRRGRGGPARARRLPRQRRERSCARAPRLPRRRSRRRRAAEPPTPAPAPAETGGNGDGGGFVSPVVARIASEHSVDVSQVPGTGRGGRVTKKDILGFVESGGRALKRRGPAPPAAEAPPPPEAAHRHPPDARAAGPAPGSAPAAAGPATGTPQHPVAAAPSRGELEAGENEEPMTAMRKGIAEHMRRSLDTSAHVTSAIEVDLSRVVDIRNKLKPELQKSYGVNLTYLIFVARAVTETLREYPWINGEIRGDKIITRNFVNLGFAVELTDGRA